MAETDKAKRDEAVSKIYNAYIGFCKHKAKERVFNLFQSTQIINFNIWVEDCTKRVRDSCEDECLVSDMSSEIQKVLNQISHFKERWSASLREALFYLENIIGVEEIGKELDQMDKDFGGWYMDGNNLCVLTENVVLEDRDFGRFEIQLALDSYKKGDGYPIQTVPEEPDWFQGEAGSYPHPHVSEYILCIGDGGEALENALVSGRICDVFTIVNSVLNTYNLEGSYASIGDWDGKECADCGEYFNENDMIECRGCGAVICPDCKHACECCLYSLCSDCVHTCRMCNEYLCSNCLHTCSKCNRVFCSSCVGVNGVCNECNHKQEETDNEQKDQ